MNMRMNAYRTEKQKQRKKKHMSSITHTQTIDCQHNNKFFSCVFNQSNVFAKYMDKNLSVYIYINISCRNNSSFGGKWSFSFSFFRKIKWHSFSL
jgi:hypothetical protein